MKKVILFQGDSITDAGRSRDNDYHVGTGYPLLVKAHLEYEKPNGYTILNRGISGNRIVDLYARIKCDFINLKPDYASILIGVNDVWHELGNRNGVAVEKFEKIYTMLVEEILAKLPSLKLTIMGAYVIPGTATVGELPEGFTGYEDKYDYFRKETEKRAAAARRVAEKFGLPFIDLQKAFDDASTSSEAAVFSGDGVHPSHAGHELIRREWMKVFEATKL